MAFSDRLKKAFGKKDNEESQSRVNHVDGEIIEDGIKTVKSKNARDDYTDNVKLDIFFSYAKEDKHKVIPKIDSIQGMGFNVKYHDDIPQGNKLDEIFEFIENCDILVVFVTDNSIKSGIVEEEFRYAVGKEKEILAIFDEDFDKIEMKNIWRFELLNVEHIYQKVPDERRFILEFENFIQDFKNKNAKSDVESNALPFDNEHPYVYVSYDDNDYKMAFREVRKLQSMDCNVLFVESDEYLKSCLPYIDNSELVILLVSNNSISSKKVQNEIKYMNVQKKSVLPIYLEDVSEMNFDIPLESGLSIYDDEYISQLAKCLENHGIKPKDPTDSKLVPGKGREPIPACDGEDPFIFVSYAHKDGYMVFPEIKLFQDMGYNVWYDEGISPGNEWLMDILNYLDKCSYFVVFVTNNSVASVNVKKEIKYAIYEEKNILPIFLEDFDEIEMSGELDSILKNIQGIPKTTMENEEYIFKFEKAFNKAGIMSLMDFEYDKMSRSFIKKNTFAHIDYLVHSGAKEIALDSDVVFDEDDIEFFNGIDLDVDEIHFDGCGNCIDARGKARIFNISGRNIVFENLIFKNAYNEFNGGAITVDSASCSFDNCKFSNNSSNENGGVFDIKRGYGLKFERCVFEGNAAKWGSVIYNNDNNLEFSMCKFSNNKSKDGEVIVSDERAVIKLENCIPKNPEIERYSYDAFSDISKVIGDDPDWDLEHRPDWDLEHRPDWDLEYEYDYEMKYVSIYICSNFNDMHAERDYILKEVFPELQEWCESLNIRLTTIDFRWGISEEASADKQTFDKLFHAIDACRPFFLCFLGQRRGWVPDFDQDISEETKNKYDMESLSGMSVVEMEIEHAFKPVTLFEKYIPMRHSLFFFRNPSYLDNLSNAQRLIYTNESEYAEDDIVHADEKLAEIKQRIRQRQSLESEENKNRSDKEKIYINVTDYEGTWDSDLWLPELSHYEKNEGRGRLTDFKCGYRSLKEVLLNQLKKEIILEFGIEETFGLVPASSFEEFLSIQNHYCSSMNSESRFFISDESTSFLWDYVKKYYDNNVCLVIAPDSYDNVLLMAKFATESLSLSNINVYKRFCGLNIDSMLVLWQSICDEAGIPEDGYLYPYSIEELKRKIPAILEGISQEGKTILIIDGINILEDGLEIFEWLDKLPENLKLIISVVNEAEIVNIKDYPYILYKSFKLDALDDARDKVNFINLFLGYTLKEFSQRQIDEICSLSGSANPLYLRILLEELKLFGSFDQLDHEIKRFGDSPLTAFDYVLERLEVDELFGEGVEVVKLLFSLLTCSKSGLSVDEIASIIKNKYDDNISYYGVRENVIINLRQVKAFIIKNGEYYSFFYGKFREAAELRYESIHNESMDLLADYFMSKVDLNGDFSFVSEDENDNERSRFLNELPFYLYETERYDDLSKVLSSFAFIKNKLELSTINNLIADYQFGQNHVFNNVEDHPIILIGKALELSAPILDKDKNQLPAQLWGRLRDIDDDLVQGLLDEISDSTSDMWLKSHSASLYSPLDLINQRFDIDFQGVKSPIVMASNNEFIYQKNGTLIAFDFFKKSHRVLDKEDSSLIKIILIDKFRIFAVYANGVIKELDIVDCKDINIFKIPAKLTDISYSKDMNKIYASSNEGIFSIDLLNNKLRKEIIYDDKEYSKILLSDSGNIVVCRGDEVNLFGESFKQTQLDLYDEGYEVQMENNDILFIGFVDRFLVTISSHQMDVVDSENVDNKCSQVITHPVDRFSQAIILENNKLVTISEMGVLRVWCITDEDDSDLNLDVVYDNFTGIRPIDIGRFTKDGEMLFIGTFNSINIVDLNEKVYLNDKIRHIGLVSSIKIDENHMITASENDIFTWDIDKEEFVNRFMIDFKCSHISYNRKDSKLVLAGVKTERDGRMTNKIAVCDITDDMWKAIETSDYKSIDLDAEDYKITYSEIIDVAQNSSGIVFIEKDKLTIGGDETILGNVATNLATEFNSDNVFVGFKDGSIVEYPSGNIFDADVGSPVTKIKVSDDKLIVGHENGSIEIFDLGGNHINSLIGHTEAINDFIIVDNSLISVSNDCTLKLWDIENDGLLLTQLFDDYATSLGFKDEKIILGFALGEVIFFNIENYL